MTIQNNVNIYNLPKGSGLGFEIGVSLNSIFRCLLENPDKRTRLVDELLSNHPNQNKGGAYL